MLSGGAPIGGFRLRLDSGAVLRDAHWVRAAAGGDRRAAPARREGVLGADGDHGGVPCGEHEQGVQGDCDVGWSDERSAEGRDDAGTGSEVCDGEEGGGVEVLLGGSY